MGLISIGKLLGISLLLYLVSLLFKFLKFIFKSSIKLLGVLMAPISAVFDILSEMDIKSTKEKKKSNNEYEFKDIIE